MNYTMSGGIFVTGFSVTTKSINLPVAFKEGDTVYLRYRALQGVLERIVIRRVRLDIIAYQAYGTYYDYLGFRYNDSDLVNQQNAVALATAYYQRIMGLTSSEAQTLVRL